MRAPSNLVETTLEHLVYLCRRMRPDEWDQIRAFYDIDDPDQVAAMIYAKASAKFTVLHEDGTPAVAGGWDCIAPGVWQAWMVGTLVGWERQWRSITKASRWMMATMFERGIARRMEMQSIASRVCAHQWYIDGLKMRFEGVKYGFGRNGEDVHFFGVLRENF